MKLRPAFDADLYRVQTALQHLAIAREFLRDSPKALAKVRVAIKSAEGAERHMKRRVMKGEEHGTAT